VKRPISAPFTEIDIESSSAVDTATTEKIHHGLLAQPAVSLDSASAIDSALSILNGLSAEDCTNDIYAVLELLLRASQSEKNAAREIRQAGYQSQVKLDLDSATKIRESADARMWGGIVSSVAQVLGGAITVGGGVVSLGASIKSANTSLLSQEAKSFGNDFRADRLALSAGKQSSLGDAAGKIGHGISEFLVGGAKLGQAYFETNSAKAESEKVALDALAHLKEQMNQDVTDHMQQQMDVIRDVLEKLRAIEQSRHDINSSIVRSM